ncbi:hypothetical protein M3Y99_00292800 [Aphelenchoides fujianensis]|nr:hypothetical protein M3Y99_00292800 [Aphelenchoides fujianensis]
MERVDEPPQPTVWTTLKAKSAEAIANFRWMFAEGGVHGRHFSRLTSIFFMRAVRDHRLLCPPTEMQGRLIAALLVLLVALSSVKAAPNLVGNPLGSSLGRRAGVAVAKAGAKHAARQAGRRARTGVRSSARQFGRQAATRARNGLFG